MAITLASVIDSARRIVFFGGAGVSTESGIPDFRSAAGLYATASGPRPPEYMLSDECLWDEPEAFWDFHRRHLLHPQARPNAAHRALAALERRGVLTAVVTQNIDGLHQLAGSRVVHELHGSVHRNHCVRCDRPMPLDEVLATTGVPRCPRCGGMVRPDVVLYGEALDAEVVDEAVRAIEDADTLIVGGTSLNVYPAAGFALRYAGDRLVLINATPTLFDRRAALLVRDPIGDALAPWDPGAPIGDADAVTGS
ncbi:MAG TPA: NAD-dependent protein deacylase [Propionibacteriaceae bacterium]|nr:NAD-dependent protein deacylase [Propionibacteriaceae bacterium]